MALPPKATSTVSGEILLSGDLAGTGDAPLLRHSGVNVDAVSASKRVSIDAKGRITSVGGLNDEERDSLIDAAYAIDPSKFTIVDGRPVIIIPVATTTTPGSVQLGANFSTSSPLQPNVASTTTLGVMQVGSGLLVSSGAVSTDSSIFLTSSGGTIGGAYQFAPIDGVVTTIAEKPVLGSTLGAYSYGGTVTNDRKSSISASSGSRIVAITRPSNTFQTISGTNYFDVTRFVVATSTTGVTWTETTLTFPSTPRGIAFGNGVFVTYGALKSDGSPVSSNSDTVIGRYWSATSTDGVAWTVTNPALISTVYYADLTFGDGLFVAAGISGTTLVSMNSSDGVTWTAGSAGGATVSNASTAVRLGAFFTGSDFCIVCGGPTTTRAVATSPNGTTWTNRTSNFPSGLLTHVAVGGNAVMIYNSNTQVMHFSSDMSTWSTSTPLTGSSLTRLDYCSGVWTAVFAQDPNNLSQPIRRVTSSNGTTWSSPLTYNASTAWFPVFGEQSLVLGSLFILLEGSNIRGDRHHSSLTSPGVTTSGIETSWARYSQSTDGLTWKAGFGFGLLPANAADLVKQGFTNETYLPSLSLSPSGRVTRTAVVDSALPMSNPSPVVFSPALAGPTVRSQRIDISTPHKVICTLITSTDILIFEE